MSWAIINLKNFNVVDLTVLVIHVIDKMDKCRDA